MRALATFSEFRDLLAGYRLPRIILTALELKLFTVMDSSTWTPPQLARSLKVSERGVTMLCRNLAMAGLLIKKGERYRSGRLGLTLLNGDHPAYRGSYIDLLADQWRDWADLTESVRTGKPVDHDEPEEPDYRSRFTWAMHQRTMDLAPRLAAGISLKGAKSLLDLGGDRGHMRWRSSPETEGCGRRSVIVPPRSKWRRPSPEATSPAQDCHACRWTC